MRETLGWAFQMSAAAPRAAIKNARSINFNGTISIKAVSRPQQQRERNFAFVLRECMRESNVNKAFCF